VKAEADRMFLLGVNQFVGHGWPYSPAAAGEPGWAFYAAAVFNAHNPWFAVMPEITKYLSRVSWLLRQGKPANDAAILLPEDDAQAAFAPGHVSVTDEMSRRITPQLMAEILDAGYNVDYIDAATIDKLGTIPYPVLVIPPTERIPLATYKKIEAYAAGSGKVIAVGKTPSLAPGLMESGDSKEIAAISERLFRGRGQRGMFSENDRWVMSQLRYRQFGDSYRSLYVKATERSAIGFICRKLPDRDIYFVANTSNHSVHAYLAFGSPHLAVQEWDPETGDVIRNGRIEVRFTNGETTHLRSDPPGISADFAPYQSRVFLMSDGSKPLPVLNAAAPPPHIETIEDLNSGWKIRFNDEKAERDLPQVNSWTELSGRQFYSGEATYTRSFTLDEVPHGSLLLDFGDGKAIADDRPPEADGMHALLDPPIREAAIIFVNGKRAGALWHPPYRLDISQFVKKGANQIEIRVYNTALNELAGQPPRDLTALRAKYGTRFEPQDMDRVKPIASGLLGPVWLEILPVQ
jgi:hypothetical protein